jgi:hypothetical protein
MISEQTETAEPAGEVGRKKKVFDCCGGKVSVGETQHIYSTRRKGGTATIAQIMHGPFFYIIFLFILHFTRGCKWNV